MKNFHFHWFFFKRLFSRNLSTEWKSRMKWDNKRLGELEYGPWMFQQTKESRCWDPFLHILTTNWVEEQNSLRMRLSSVWPKLTNRKPECFWPESGQTQSRLDGVCGVKIKEGKNKWGKEFGVLFHFWLLRIQIKSGNVTLPVLEERNKTKQKTLDYFLKRDQMDIFINISWYSTIFLLITICKLTMFQMFYMYITTQLWSNVLVVLNIKVFIFIFNKVSLYFIYFCTLDLLYIIISH